jgi:hypothetical protein
VHVSCAHNLFEKRRIEFIFALLLGQLHKHLGFAQHFTSNDIRLWKYNQLKPANWDQESLTRMDTVTAIMRGKERTQENSDFVAIYFMIVNVFRVFNPYRSTTTDEALRQFVSATLEPNILSIPGIGHKNAQHLREDNFGNYHLRSISNSYELMGKFLSMKAEGVGCVDHCQKFYDYLLEKGVLHNTDDIVQAVAAKADSFISGIYDRKYMNYFLTQNTDMCTFVDPASLYGPYSAPWREQEHPHIHSGDEMVVPIHE